LITGIPASKIKLTQYVARLNSISPPSVDGREGKRGQKLISRMDDEIVNDLFEKFPEFKFDDALRNLDEDWMKSKAGKEKWRAFIMPVSSTPETVAHMSIKLMCSTRRQSMSTTLVHSSGKTPKDYTPRTTLSW
jgi:hypothetical protein